MKELIKPLIYIAFGWLLSVIQFGVTEFSHQKTIRIAIEKPTTSIQNDINKVKGRRDGTVDMNLNNSINDTIPKKRGLFRKRFKN